VPAVIIPQTFYCIQMPYCILIDALAKGGNIWEAKMLFNDMKEKGVKSGTTSNQIPLFQFLILNVVKQFLNPD
jgi:pentatricopeptide repeat protein